MAQMKTLNGYEVCDQTARDKATSASNTASSALSNANTALSKIPSLPLSLANGGTGGERFCGCEESEDGLS